METTPQILFALILILGCYVSTALDADDADKIRIILDTDANNELDDQHAIAYLLFNGDTFAVEGITVNATSGGGVVVPRVLRINRSAVTLALN